MEKLYNSSTGTTIRFLLFLLILNDLEIAYNYRVRISKFEETIHIIIKLLILTGFVLTSIQFVFLTIQDNRAWKLKLTSEKNFLANYFFILFWLVSALLITPKARISLGNIWGYIVRDYFWLIMLLITEIWHSLYFKKLKYFKDCVEKRMEEAQYGQTQKKLLSHQPNSSPEMILIPAGTFQMGDVFGDDRNIIRAFQVQGLILVAKVHKVTLDAFYIRNHTVTSDEYDVFCEAINRKLSNHNWYDGDRPVVNVSWFDAVEYCNWRSQQEGFEPVYTIKGEQVTANWNAKGYRLPTEAEWEYAAREGGKKVRFGNGEDIADPKIINFDSSERFKDQFSITGFYRGKTIDVGSLPPNSLGLHEMSGNVVEWCWDFFKPYYYIFSPKNNPKGPKSGVYRVLRGGSFHSNAWLSRASSREFEIPSNTHATVGFRIARRF